MQTSNVQRIEATISRFGKIQQSQYPPYAQVQSVLFVWTHQGQAQEIWKTYPAAEAQQLKAGQRVFLSSRTGRNNQLVWEVELEGQPVAPPAINSAQRPVPLPAAHQPNADVVLWVEQQADLYAQCFDAAWRTLAAREVSEETVRAAASTLFISASRKFHLER